jgi:hypothetical protein
MGASVAPSPFAGRVFVVAGSSAPLGAAADALTAAEALVAVVGPVRLMTDAAAHFHADPTDGRVWERVVPHVEQRLGPIDGVLSDRAAQPIAEQRVGPDFRRRGHGAVVVVDDGIDVDDALRTLADTL